MKRTWKPRERVSPACFPPNQDLLVAVKEFPEAGVTSASQKVILLKGRSVSISNSNDAIEEATGRSKVAPNAPLQPLFPERSDSQFPLTPCRGTNHDATCLSPPTAAVVGALVTAGAGVVAGAGP